MPEITFVPGIASTSPVPRKAVETPAADTASFADSLREAMTDVNASQNAANAAMTDLQTGKAALHETLIAVEKADLSFRLLMQVRNKVLEAYKEVMRMNV